MNLESIVEINIKYKNGQVATYKNKNIEKFVEMILEEYELSGEEVVVVEGNHRQMDLTYKSEKGKSPMEIAKDMQKQVKGIFKI